MSSAPGSVTVLVSWICVPSGDVAGAPLIVAVGFALVTVIVFVAECEPPSSSLAVNVTR